MVEKDHERRRGTTAGVFGLLEQFGDAICSTAGRHSRYVALTLVASVGMFVFSNPVAAQEFCQSAPGQLMTLAVNTSITVIASAILLGIIIGGVLRSVGLRSVGNLLVGGAAVAVLILVGGIWFADTALALVPGASMDSACGAVG